VEQYASPPTPMISTPPTLASPIFPKAECTTKKSPGAHS
jgi:hypothetical protein